MGESIANSEMPRPRPFDIPLPFPETRVPLHFEFNSVQGQSLSEWVQVVSCPIVQVAFNLSQKQGLEMGQVRASSSKNSNFLSELFDTDMTNKNKKKSGSLIKVKFRLFGSNEV
jgi:hypothetical protein